MRNKQQIAWFMVIFLSIFSMQVSAQIVKVNKDYCVIGHRGGVTENRVHPENSKVALTCARNRGYTGVEIDIRESKDSVLFLYHYSTLERDFDSNARCEDLTWEELKKLRPLHKDGEP